MRKDVQVSVLGIQDAGGGAGATGPCPSGGRSTWRREGRTAETVDRSALRAVQTPQVFEAGLIRGAIQKALEDGELLTDDCGAVERLGMPVTLTRGSRENIKITTPLDLILGEAILQARAEEGEWRCRE